MSLEATQDLLDYNRRSFESFERGIRKLGWKEASKNREIGHESFVDTLVHILNVQEAWSVIIPQKNWKMFEDPTRRAASINDWKAFTNYRKRVWTELDEFRANLTEKELRRKVKAPWFPAACTIEEGIIQATFEQAHHLGEIIAGYWQMDKAPPQMMWLPIHKGFRAAVA